MNETRANPAFRIVLTCEPPTDPRKRLAKLADVTTRLEQQNERMALGLRHGFRALSVRRGKAE
jgi:hypothetical protein